MLGPTGIDELNREGVFTNDSERKGQSVAAVKWCKLVRLFTSLQQSKLPSHGVLSNPLEHMNCHAPFNTSSRSISHPNDA